MRRFLESWVAGCLAMGFGVMSAACGDGYEIGPEWDMSESLIDQGLEPVSSCEAAASALRTATYESVKRELYTSMIQRLESHDSMCASRGGIFLSAPAEDSAGSGTGSGSGGGASQYSTTNNQVVGVDEADFIKNDAEFVYMLSGASLHIVDAWPAEQAQRIGTLAIEGTPKKLFVHADRAVVYSSLEPSSTTQPDPYGYPGQGECTYGYQCQFGGDGHPTKVTVIDLSDKSAPQVIRELRFSGSYVNARRIEDMVHTVLTDPAPTIPNVSHYVDVSCDDSLQDIVDNYTAVLRDNDRIIAAAELAVTFPTTSDSAAGSDASVDEQDCESYLQGRLSSTPAFTTVASFDMLHAAPAPRLTRIVSDAGAVYASHRSLYLAVPANRGTGNTWFGGHADASQLSIVHRFDLDEAGFSEYTASGAVKGRVLNQFAMDEHNDDLRIATTSGYVPDPNVHSTLNVMRRAGDELAVIGAIDNIAPSEDIRSVRFDGDRGFVVTFKKTDPLFVFDLSEPKQPRTLAELKIPGFSTYMHMMDEHHLLTIGYDADDHGDFAYFDGVLLQIFDVTNPSAPALTHKEVIGTRGSSSEALTNHLAFNYFAPKDLLALPMTICEGGDDGTYGSTMSFSGLMVYDVTAQAGFNLHGQLSVPLSSSQSSDYSNQGCANWWTNASSTVKRSVIMDDYVFAVTDSAINISHLDNLASALVTIDLTQP